MTERIVINPGWSHYQKRTYSPAVKKGNLLFITGQDGSQYDPVAGKPVIKGDIVAQTEVIYEKLRAILEAAGASFDDDVMTTDYITTTEGYKETAKVRRRYFKDSFPASTGIIVKGLLGKDALIEIDAVAVID